MHTINLNGKQRKALCFFALLTAAMLLLEKIVASSHFTYLNLIGLLSFLFSAAIIFFMDRFRIADKAKEKYIKLFAVLIAAAATAFGIHLHLCCFGGIEAFSSASPFRVILLTLPCFIVLCYVTYEAKIVSDFLHRNRWYIAFAIFVLFVALKLNFSNASLFTYYIQPNSTTDFTSPLFGIPRGIRSDEWLVDTPRRISAEYSNYGMFNYIVRGTQNYNISSSYLYLSYSALSNPFYWGYFLFGSEFGASFHMCGIMITSIIFSYELGFIISKNSRKIALFAAAAMGLSGFVLWWSITLHFISISAIIVCAYYFLQKEKTHEKALLAIAVALFGSLWICNLYPAWQVPLAYFLVAVLAWIIVTNLEKIKSMKPKHWAIVAAAFLFMCSVVLAYLKDSSDYMQAVLDTVYPGKRFDAGGNSFYKGSWYIQSLLYPFLDTGNNSEASVFFCLFPLPMILALVTVIKQAVQKLKNKTGTIDWLLVFLLIPAAFFTIYCTVGIPSWLAKITLMSYSMALRTIDVLCLINTYLLIRLLSYTNEQKLNAPIWAGVLVSVALIAFNTVSTEKHHPDFMPTIYASLITLVIIGLVVSLLCKVPKKFRNTAILTVTLAIGISGACVLPISRGFDSIFEKPASYAVKEIVEKDPDAKWIGYDSFVTPQFLIANGAPTINSVNYIPNMELWSQLDPTGQYNEVYNRYSHVICNFGEETRFELVQSDCMKVTVSYEDVKKTGAEYLFALSPLSESTELFDYQLLYNEDNIFIYKITYNE